MNAPSPLALGYAAAARRVEKTNSEFDDVAQEAAIRVAEVRARKPEASTAYLAGAARHRVLDMARGRPYTGSTSGRGPNDPLRRSETASLDGLAEAADATESQFLVTDLSEEFEAAEWSTLRPLIDAAIESIPCTTNTPKIISRLVAAGLSASEAGRLAGLSSEGGRKAWQLAREHLRVQLAHLEGVVAA